MLQKKQWGCPQMPVDGISCFAVILLTHVYFKRALREASYLSHCLMHCKSWQYCFVVVVWMGLECA